MNPKLSQAMRLAIRTAPAAALVSSIVYPTALADPGDLVPGFADVGRLSAPEGLFGFAFSVEAQDDNFLFTGGEYIYYSWYYQPFTNGFGGRLSADGALDTTFETPGISGVMVTDSAMQADGKIVGVGHRIRDQQDDKVAFRLERDGALDTTFGVNGTVELDEIDNIGSLALDPNGTLVIAGSLGSNLKVLRLLADGTLDDTFGTGGVFTAPALVGDETAPDRPRILIADGGGYRVTDNDVDPAFIQRCRVLAITASGTVDESFGDQGYAGMTPAGVGGYCTSLEEQPDGKLVVGGWAAGLPALVRLVATGAVDGAFATDALQATEMSLPAALAIDPGTDAIIVAGSGPESTAGFPVVRVNGDGSLDDTFGNDGTSWIDLPNASYAYAFVGDVDLATNGDVLIAGGTRAGFSPSVPFVARLSGGDGVDGPGVIGLRNPDLPTTEGGDQVVTVRRMGGKTGSVSVTYEARIGDGGSGEFFTAGEDDFTPTSATLTWADGDTTDKTFVVPIAAHDGSTEEEESFVVELTDPQGGAGLGTYIGTVRIASDATSAGMFSIELGSDVVNEAGGTIQVYVARTYSWTGAVTVSVTATSGAATAGDDFGADPITVSFADGDSGWKPVDIPIVDDSVDESNESFTVQLSDPTGGAVIGPRSSLSLSIVDNDPLPGGGGSGGDDDDDGGGGGGSLGWASPLLLAVARWRRVRSTVAGRISGA